MPTGMSIELDAGESRAVRGVLERPGLTRAELAADIAVSMPTASALVKRLLDLGVLVESGSTPSTGGRPAVKLSLSKGFGYTCSHQFMDGRLASCAIGPTGQMLGMVDRPVADASGAVRAIAAAELELTAKTGDLRQLASAMIIPGTVDHISNTGVAPWQFGSGVFDPSGTSPQTLLLSSSECLSTSSGSIAVDMVHCLSGTFIAPGGEKVPLRLDHFDPDPAAVSAHALGDAIREAASGAASAIEASEGADPKAALAKALAANDYSARKLADRLTGDVLEFVGVLCRTLRPGRLVVASVLADPALGLAEEIAAGLHRYTGIAPQNINLVAPQAAIEARFLRASHVALRHALEVSEHQR